MSFEDAVRKRLNLEGEYHIHVDASGGGQVQIGDYTWDSDPYEFDLTAQPVTVHIERRKTPSMFTSSFSAWERGEQPEPTTYDEFTFHRPDDSRPRFTKTFNSIPEIWSWLEEAPDAETAT